MNTANFTDWNGDLLLIGPIYPFVGWEVFMVVLGFIFWIGWHYLQMRAENRLLDEQASKLKQPDDLQKALRDEHSPERM